MEEHPVQQPIRGIQLDKLEGYGPEGDGNCYFVGDNGVTRIEACQKSGLHANIPYVRVWAGDICLAEFCQHNIVGVYFADAVAARAGRAQTDDAELIARALCEHSGHDPNEMIEAGTPTGEPADFPAWMFEMPAARAVVSAIRASVSPTPGSSGD